MKARYSVNAKRGFTLIEIMIVIAIIGVLATVVIGALSRAQVSGRIASVHIELKGIQSAMEALRADTGLYPNGAQSVCRDIASLPSDNELDLTTAAAGLNGNGASLIGWRGPYIQVANDPWDNPYYLDEDYQCLADTEGCQGQADASAISSVIVSCGQNGAIDQGACAYDDDNVVYLLCRR